MHIEAELKYYRNPNTGEHHKALEAWGRRFVLEVCGFDAIAHEQTITQEAAFAGVASGGSWCGHCCLFEAEQAIVSDTASG